jgi:hypothetical protein
VQAAEAETSRMEAVKSEGMDVEPEGMAVEVEPEGMAVRTAVCIGVAEAEADEVAVEVEPEGMAVCTAVRIGVAEAEADEVTVEVEPEGYKVDGLVAEYKHDLIRILLLIDVLYPLVNGVILLPQMRPLYVPFLFVVHYPAIAACSVRL